jgi:hypothetical protein
MIDILTLLLRIAGGVLILLAALHIPIGKRLNWAEDARRLSPVNASIFHVHTFFICLVLVLMGLPCLVEPGLFLEPTRAGVWITWSISAFWAVRLYFQWCVYPPALWRGKRMESFVHAWFTLVWAGLAGLFAVCGMIQSAWWVIA